MSATPQRRPSSISGNGGTSHRRPSCLPASRFGTWTLLASTFKPAPRASTSQPDSGSAPDNSLFRGTAPPSSKSPCPSTSTVTPDGLRRLRELQLQRNLPGRRFPGSADAVLTRRKPPFDQGISLNDLGNACKIRPRAAIELISNQQAYALH